MSMSGPRSKVALDSGRSTSARPRPQTDGIRLPPDDTDSPPLGGTPKMGGLSASQYQSLDTVSMGEPRIHTGNRMWIDPAPRYREGPCQSRPNTA